MHIYTHTHALYFCLNLPMHHTHHDADTSYTFLSRDALLYYLILDNSSSNIPLRLIHLHVLHLTYNTARHSSPSNLCLATVPTSFISLPKTLNSVRSTPPTSTRASSTPANTITKKPTPGRTPLLHQLLQGRRGHHSFVRFRVGPKVMEQRILDFLSHFTRASGGWKGHLSGCQKSLL